MGDSNKQEDIHADDNHVEDIIDSDELFDLDMPLDEPDDIQQSALSEIQDDIPEEPNEEIQTTVPENENPDIGNSLQGFMDEFPDSAPQDDGTKQPEEEQETLLTVEQDLEHLLDRNDSNSDSEEIFEQAPESVNTDAVDVEENAASADASTLPETEPMKEMPVTEKTKAKPGFGMANSFMITLGLIAILIAALAAWLGLDASQQQSNLASVSSNLQQQIKLLKQQQEQQQSLLTQHIETLEKRLNTLTQVIANKTTEQWRASLQQKPARPEKTVIAQAETSGLRPAQTDMPATPESATRAVRKIAANKVPKAKKSILTPATVVKTPAAVKPVVKSSPATAPLSMYEVAPGTVKGWVVNIYSATSRSTAERRVRQLKTKNIDAKYVRVQIKGKTWYRVRASGFKDKHAAATFKKFLQEYHGIDAWYSYLK